MIPMIMSYSDRMHQSQVMFCEEGKLIVESLWFSVFSVPMLQTVIIIGDEKFRYKQDNNKMKYLCFNPSGTTILCIEISRYMINSTFTILSVVRSLLMTLCMLVGITKWRNLIPFSNACSLMIQLIYSSPLWVDYFLIKGCKYYYLLIIFGF